MPEREPAASVEFKAKMETKAAQQIYLPAITASRVPACLDKGAMVCVSFAAEARRKTGRDRREIY
jgi:hypothetical protein